MANPSTYRYGAFQRWVLVVGGLLFAIAPPYALLAHTPDDLGDKVAIVLLTCMGWASLYVGWRLLPSIRVDERGITRTRLWIRRHLPWVELTEVVHRGWGSALVVRAGRRSIRIEEQLVGYAQLFASLHAARPDLIGSTPISFPVELRRRFGWDVWGVILIIAGPLIAYHYGAPLWTNASWGLGDATQTLFGVACFAGGFWMLFLTESRVVFHRHSIERWTPLTRETLPVYRFVDVEHSSEEDPELGVMQWLRLTWLGATSVYEASAQVLVLDGMRLNGDLEALEPFLIENYTWLEEDESYVDAA